MNRSNGLKKSTIYKALSLLSAGDQKKLLLLAASQVLLGFLDLIGVGLIGVLGAVAVRGVQSLPAGGRVSSILKILHISNFSLQNQSALIGLLAVALMLLRTFLSILLNKKSLRFLSIRGAFLSVDLFDKTLSLPIVVLQAKNSQERLFALTNSVTTIMVGILAPAANLLSDFSVLVFLFLGLLFVDPLTAILSLSIFGLVAVLLHRLLHTKAKSLGEAETRYNIDTNEVILNSLSLFREIFIGNKKKEFVSELKIARVNQAEVNAQISFLPNITKYVSESVLLIATLAVAAVQFLLQDAVQAIASFGIFLAAGSRMAPAVMRLQQNLLMIKGNIGNSAIGFNFIEELNLNLLKSDADITYDEVKKFTAEIHLREVNFRYPDSTQDVVRNINLHITPGMRIAIAGPSGAGKSTLIDLILGVLSPSSGTVTVSGLIPKDALRNWPGKIGYAPQNTILINKTLGQNVSLNSEFQLESREQIWDALRIAQLDDFALRLPEELDTYVSENGTNFSGGQKQRIGIARALFTHPKLLILDESTSALDGLTEQAFTSALATLKNDVTVLVVAHRLSTIRNADKVIYMKDGSILAEGTFDSVRAQVPEFDSQLKISGM